MYVYIHCWQNALKSQSTELAAKMKEINVFLGRGREIEAKGGRRRGLKGDCFKKKNGGAMALSGLLFPVCCNKLQKNMTITRWI